MLMPPFLHRFVNAIHNIRDDKQWPGLACECPSLDLFSPLSPRCESLCPHFREIFVRLFKSEVIFFASTGAADGAAAAAATTAATAATATAIATAARLFIRLHRAEPSLYIVVCVFVCNVRISDSKCLANHLASALRILSKDEISSAAQRKVICCCRSHAYCELSLSLHNVSPALRELHHCIDLLLIRSSFSSSHSSSVLPPPRRLVLGALVPIPSRLRAPLRLRARQFDFNVNL